VPSITYSLFFFSFLNSALQRRSKVRTGSASGAGGAVMPDSDKILLQVYYDVRLFGTILAGLGYDTSTVKAYISLQEEVAEGKAASRLLKTIYLYQ